LTDFRSCDKVLSEETEEKVKNMSNIPLYFIGPATGLFILIIGVIIGLLTGSELDITTVLGIALGIAFLTEFSVMFSILEKEKL
jgi:C4-dicarboxylate transporter